MSIKITDVAAFANVSPSVVSRVLHNSGYVSSEKRAAVELALKELGYVPNQIAQGLKKQKTRIIGHILPSVHPNPFFAGVSYGADTEADKLGYHTLTLFSYGDPKREEMLINELISRMVDGVIFTGAGSSAAVKKLKDNGIPVVMVERSRGIVGVDKVLVDNFSGAYSAVEHLLENNHKKVAYIGVELIGGVENDRYNGYVEALKAADISLEEGYVRFVGGYEPKKGYEAAESLLSTSAAPTAIFTSSDLLAIGIFQYLYKKGIRVPEDISIVGYDDSLAEFLAPPMTTVANPVHELGRSAVQLITDRIGTKDSVTKTLTLHTKLIIRESVQKLK